jgi:hypothetical protein
MIVLGLVNFFTTYPLYLLFLDMVEKTVIKSRFVEHYPVSTSLFLMNLVSCTWVYFWQIKLWVDLRNYQKEYAIQPISWALASMGTLLLPVLFLLLSFILTGLEIFPLICGVVSTVIGGFSFRDVFWKKRHLPMPPIRDPFVDFGIVVRAAVMVSGLVTLMLMMGNIMIPYNIVGITIKTIAPLTGSYSASSDAIMMIIEQYLLPYSLFPPIFITNFLALLLITWTLRNSLKFLRIYALKTSEIFSEIKQDK